MKIVKREYLFSTIDFIEYHAMKISSENYLLTYTSDYELFDSFSFISIVAVSQAQLSKSAKIVLRCFACLT